MSDAHDSINRKTEEAFSSYFGTLGTGITFLQGLAATAKTLPSCVVFAGNAQESFPNSSVYRLPVSFVVESKRGDTTGAAHGLLVGKVCDCIDNTAAVMTALNRPAPPAPDLRTVTSYYLQYISSAVVTGSVDGEKQSMKTTITPEIVAQGWNHIAEPVVP